MPSFLDPVRPIVAQALPSPVGGAPATTNSYKLPGFTMQHQENGEWCWAAVSCSIAVFFGSGQWTQCDIASSELNLFCCVKPVPIKCNIPWSLDTALSLVGHFNSYSAGPASYAQIQNELAQGKPMGVRISWLGAHGAHFIAIGGSLVDPNGNHFVDFFDPFNGNGQIEYSDLVSGYRTPGDSWTHTYLTIPKMIVAGGAPSPGPSPISA